MPGKAMLRTDHMPMIYVSFTCVFTLDISLHIRLSSRFIHNHLYYLASVFPSSAAREVAACTDLSTVSLKLRDSNI